MKFPYVLQESSYDCGIACLMTCFLNKNIDIKKDDILKYLYDKKDGISAYELIKTSNNLGVSAKGVKCEVNILTKEMLPVIAHTIIDKHYHHYMTILDLNSKRQVLTILDPSIGIKKMSYEEFLKISTKVFIIFEKNTRKKKNNNTFKKYLIKILRRNKKEIRNALLISFLLLMVIFVSQYWLNILLMILEMKNLNYLISFLIIFFFLTGVKELFENFSSKILIKFQNHLDKNLHKEITHHLLHLPYTYFLYRSKTEISNNVLDIETFKEFIIQIFINCFVNIVILIAILFILLSYHLILSIILIILSVTLIFLTKKYSDTLKNSYVPLKKERLIYSSCLINTLTSYQTLKGLHIEKFMYNKNKSYYKNYLKYNYLYQNKREKYDFIFNIFVNFGLILSIMFSSFLIFNNYLDLNFLILYYNFFNIYVDFLKRVLSVILTYPVYKESLSKVLDIVDTDMEVFDETFFLNIKKIVLKDVCYSILDKNILSFLSLTIHAQERILLRGDSGSGKSTLIKLILGYLEKSSGFIYYDDIEQNDIKKDLIRDNIVYVSQEDNLFAGSLYDNLRIGNVSNKMIDKACRCCYLNEMFDGSNSYLDYFIFENGDNLSGGQRARIKIARALLRAKNILVLDESFNGLDLLSIRKIIKNIFSNYKYLTLIVISHNEGIEDLFMKVYYLDGGKLYEKNK